MRSTDIQGLLALKELRLQKLKEQAALYGPSIDPSVLIEIDKLQEEIDRLREELQNNEQGIGGQVFDQKNINLLLGKVEKFWIERVLYRYEKKRKLFSFNLLYEPNAVENPWDKIIKFVNPEDSGIQNLDIGEIFDEAQGKLLILGKPGSGKTTVLLELTRFLIARVKQGSLTVIPVVFNLSSWAETRKPLREWLIDELSDKYYIPRNINTNWVDERLVLLLDGLDEVKSEYREECVRYINQYRQDHEHVKMAVCCRDDEYKMLSVRLKLENAVILQPLTASQVEEYLSSSRDLWLELQSLLHKDPTWQEFVYSPLLLNIIFDAYKGSALNIPIQLDSTDERREFLFTNYIDHMLDVFVKDMFNHRVTNERFSRTQTLQWLHWLAKKMTEHGQTLFLIEKIQPNWLQPTQYSIYSIGIRLLIFFLTGGILGLATGFSAGLVLGARTGLGSGLAFGLAWGVIGLLTIERSFGWQGILIVALAVGVAFGITGWLVWGGFAAITFGLIGVFIGSLAFGIGSRYVDSIHSLGTPNKIVLIETLKWSWEKARKSLFSWIIFGFLVGLGIGLPVSWAAGAKAGWTYGVMVNLVYVVTLGIAGGLTSGEIELKEKPNQGIRRSWSNGTLYGMVFGCILGSISGLLFGIVFGIENGLIGGVAIGLAGWVIGWFLCGGLTFMQHYFLRILLYLNKSMPWNYSKFLDFASERIFLRKIGGCYIFLHGFLLDHFANLEEKYNRE